MAKSTPYVLSAGAITLAHGLVVDKREARDLLVTTLAVGLAAVVSAALDAVLPGLGTGVSVLMLTVTALTLGPDLATRLAKTVNQGG